MVGKRSRPYLGIASVKVPRTMCRSDQRSVAALNAIVEAQDGGLDGYPDYAQALKEIRQGRKRSCWMWYIWPSMQGIRSHRMPEMLLPSLEAAIKYLKHEVLHERLIEITIAADEVLSSGRATPTWLFGHDLDSTKVHEACTFFGIAAVASNRMGNAALFFRFAQKHYGGLNDTVMIHFQSDDQMDRRLLSSVSQFANQVYSNGRLQQT
jgi:uncharacterized protein (DUF1810 family)